mmetsp:Transcript_5321/g.10978  ORF Transcript_5321/g.10978 Transcript_5321/m.10978 type:complete len:108 (-) Transcript_5321:232-555(-)
MLLLVSIFRDASNQDTRAKDCEICNSTDVQTGSKNNIPFNGLAGCFHLSVQSWVSNNSCTVANLSTQLIQTSDTTYNRPLLDICQLAYGTKRNPTCPFKHNMHQTQF